MAHLLGKVFSTAALFLILKVKFLMTEIFKKIFWKQIYFYKYLYLEIFLHIFKIGYSRVVENISPEEISHDLWKSNQF